MPTPRESAEAGAGGRHLWHGRHALALTLAALLITLALVAYFRYRQDPERAAADRESRAASERLRQLGANAQAYWRQQGMPAPPPDPLAPAIPSDADELAQIKAWQRLNQQQRDLLRTPGPGQE